MILVGYENKTLDAALRRMAQEGGRCYGRVPVELFESHTCKILNFRLLLGCYRFGINGSNLWAWAASD